MAYPKLTPIIAGGTTEPRYLADRCGDVLNVKDFGATGDGVADDTAALNAAVTAAAGKKLFFPAGTYLTKTGIGIPSNTEVYGAGMWSTTIKLTDDAPYATHCVRNEQNVWIRGGDAWQENTGNANIILRDIAVDGNGWVTTQQEGIAKYGCAIQFSYVDNLLIENVRAFNGKLHCLDIASAIYQDNDGTDHEGWYYGASSNVRIVNPVVYDCYGDDCLTTHWSHDITIINPVIYRTKPLQYGHTHGLEIDDGSYRVFVRGGYVRDHNCGLQVKGHGTNYYYPAHDVTVDGLVCEDNILNFWITHPGAFGEDSDVDGAPIKNIAIINCTAIVTSYLPPIAEGVAYYQQDGDRVRRCGIALGGASGGLVKNFSFIGDGVTETATFTVRVGNSENVIFENLNIYNAVGFSGIVYMPNDNRKGIRFKNTIVKDCNDVPAFYFGGSRKYTVDIDGVEASRTAGNSDDVPLILTSDTRTAFGYNSISIRNVYNYTGYSRILGEYLSDEEATPSLDMQQSKSCEAEFSTFDKIFWTRAVSKDKADSTPTPVLKLGYLVGYQGTGTEGATAGIGKGEGTAIAFYMKNGSSNPAHVAYVGSYKFNATAGNISHYLVFATRSNSDAGTTPTIRWFIDSSGDLRPFETNTYNIGASNKTVANLYASSGPWSSSDRRLKDNVASPAEALMRAWGKVGFKVFQMKDAIEKKGEENARLHVGVIAQDVQDAFASEGLDAGRYGLFGYDTWEDENGETHDKFSIRYEEALALECAYQRWRLEQLEERVNQLTNNSNN